MHGGCLCLQGALQVGDLFFLCQSRLLDAFGQGAAGFAEADQCLLKLGNLVGRRCHPRSFNHAQKYIVKRIDIAKDGQHLADCPRLSRRDDRRQGRLQILQDVFDVGIGLFAHGASLPFLQLQRTQGLLQCIQRGLH